MFCVLFFLSLAQHYFERALVIDPEHSSLDQLRIQIAKGKRNNVFTPFRFDRSWVNPGE